MAERTARIVNRQSAALLGIATMCAPLAANSATMTTVGVIPAAADGALPLGLTALDGKYYGVASYGGAQGYSAGVVFRLNSKTGIETVQHAFQGGTDGAIPQAPLTAFDGKLYGVTGQGGANGGGVIYTIDPATSAETPVASLPPTTYSYSQLVVFDGLLYGTGHYCGSGQGCIFSLDPATGSVRVNYAFKSGAKDGKDPGSLIVHGGYLFGATASGGPDSGGTLFRFNPANDSFKVMYAFGGSGDGAGANPALNEYGGLLYGTTQSGGSDGAGTVFSYDPVTQTETVLHSFTGKDGKSPANGLRQSGGLLYGSTFLGGASGNGGVYSIDPASGQTLILHSFTAAEASRLQAEFIVADGLLFGANGSGGTVDEGEIYSVDPSSGQFTGVHQFGGEPSYHVPSALTTVGGVYYGVSDTGGSNALGSIFKFAPNSGSVKTVHSFVGEDGATPEAALLNVAGTLYGTSYIGGASNAGTVFSFDPSNHVLTTLYSFDGTTGALPSKRLVQLGNALYGTTESGGAGYGTVFKLDLGSLKVSQVANFSAQAGEFVSGLASDGTFLYGVTEDGGTQALGDIFKVDPVSGTLSVLYSFQGSTDGQRPTGDLYYSNAALYGTTSGGKSVPATVFRFDLVAGTKTLLHSLKKATVIGAGVVQKGGRLFGTIQVSNGLNEPSGGVFSTDPGTGGTKIFPSTFNAGTNPNAPLVASSGSALFGTTTSGGYGSTGTIYKFVP